MSTKPYLMTRMTDFTSLNSTAPDDVSQHHLAYDKHLHQITLVNDVYDGVDEVVQYLFQFPQETKESFITRQQRATLRNFVKRATQAFTGMIFRKPIEIARYGPRTTKLFERIDTVNHIEHFTKDVANAVAKDGITYILADSPQHNSRNTKTNQPYLMLVQREQLINWRKDEYGNFTMIVIAEMIVEAYGLFGSRYVRQWRVYNLDEETKAVTITLYRNKDGMASPEGKATANTLATMKSYYIFDTIATEFLAIPIQEVFVDNTPLLYDIAKMNIKHFNRLSHKDRYLTMAALPIPVIWGAEIDDEGQTTTAKPALVIGVDEAFVFSGSKEDSDFQWRELSGDSINLIEDDLNAIVEDITTGILRAAESANAVQKTATEVQLLQAEASNRVTQIATAVQIGMIRSLEILSEINNERVPTTATFIINKDFNASLMGSDGARVVMESYLMGMISMETFLQTLADMELISIDSARDEMARIEADTFVPVPKIESGGESPAGGGGVDKRTLGATNNKDKKNLTPSDKANRKVSKDLKGKANNTEKKK